MAFHIANTSRIYDGHGYSGVHCYAAGVPHDKTYDTEEEALADLTKILAIRGVAATGFCVLEAKKIVTFDFGMDTFVAVEAPEGTDPDILHALALEKFKERLAEGDVVLEFLGNPNL